MMALQQYAPISTAGVCTAQVDWILYSTLALLIGVSLYALIYMIGTIVSRPQVKGMARAGITEILSLSVFIIILVGIVNGLCNITPAYLGLDFNTKGMGGVDTNSIPLVKLGETYLHLIYYLAEKLYKSLLIQITYSSMMAGTKVDAGSTLGTLAPLSGLEPILQTAGLLFNSVTVLMLSVSVQLFTLKFFEHSAFTIFLPLGILFRVIPATRSFGGALISLVIAGSVVYPLFLAYNYYIFVRNVDVDPAQLNSFLYNMPTCTADEECNSGSCLIPSGQTLGYCAPCVIEGKPPDNDPSLCCKNAPYSNSEKKCVLDEDMGMGKGGIIMDGASYSGIGITAAVATLTVFAIVAKLVGAVGGALATIATVGMGILKAIPLGIGTSPITTLLFVLFINADFFFVAVMLPAMEFIILIELVRTLSASMGEQIDLIQVFRVI